MLLQVYAADGTLLGSANGDQSPLPPLTVNVPAGSARLVVTDSGERTSFTLTVSYPAP